MQQLHVEIRPDLADVRVCRRRPLHLLVSPVDIQDRLMDDVPYVQSSLEGAEDSEDRLRAFEDRATILLGLL